MNTNRSTRLFQRAQQLLPGGVDSPVRAFKSVGASPALHPPRVGRPHRGHRRQPLHRLCDVVGTADSRSCAARARQGAGCGGQRWYQLRCAKPAGGGARRARRALMPSLERVRFVNSGTEAAMSAVRVARAATGRDRILKFEGCYHGHADAFLVKAGSGALTLGTPTSPGVHARHFRRHARRRLQRSRRRSRRVFDANAIRSPRVIVEPIAGNMGVVPPADGFLAGCARSPPRRRAADLRRGDLRISRCSRRRAGAPACARI